VLSRLPSAPLLALVTVCLLAGAAPAQADTAALGATGRLSGLIQDVAGRPFADAGVVAADVRSGAVVATGRSDSTGHYDVAVADGRYDFSVAAPTANGERRASVDDVQVEGDTKLNVTIVGQPKRSVGLRGTVRDGDGRPVPFATVSAGGTTVTDPDGRFDLETPAGEHPLEIVRPLPENSRIAVEAGGFKLSDDRELHVTVKTVGLTVRVRDSSGRPVPGVEVFASSNESCESCTGAFEIAGLATSRRSSVRARTNSEGIVHLQALPATSVTIGVEPPYMSGHSTVVQQGVHLTDDMEFAMVVGWNTAADSRFAAAAASPANARLTGVARTADGAPLAGGADIYLYAGEHLVIHDEVNGDGSFSLSAPPGRYTLRINGPEEDDDWDRGYEPEHDAYSITIPDLDLSADTQRDLVIPAAAVLVRVLDPAGVPVPDAWVRADASGTSAQFPVAPGLTGSGTVSSYRHTGADGVARIRMLSGTAAGVSVEPPGGRGLPTSMTFPAGTGATRDIRLDWGPTLRGHARTPAGEPAYLDAARLSGDGLSSRITTGADGTYAVTAEPGRYGISLDPPDEFHTPSSSVSYATLTSEQTIELTADRTLDLVIPGDRATTVSAVDVAGRPAGEWNEDFSGTGFEKLSLAPGLEATTRFVAYGPGSYGDTADLPALAPSAIKGDLMYLGDEDYEIDGARVFPGQRNVFAAAYGTTLPTPDIPTAHAGPGATAGTIVVGWSPVASDGDIRAYLIVPGHDFSAATWVPAPATIGELRGLTPGSGHTVSLYALSRYGLSDATDVLAYAADGDLPPLGPGDDGPTGGPGGPSAGSPVGMSGATNGPKTGSGYWLLTADGAVSAFGEVADITPAAALPAGVTAVDLEPTPAHDGYWVLGSDGGVRPVGAAPALGSVEPALLASGERPTSLSATPSGRGYWVFTDRGRVIPFGDAQTFGDMTGTKLNGPVLGSVAMPTGKGYYMVASDGGIFAFGDAKFEGSMGATKLNAPVQSLVPDSDGKGYWLVASDGGIFAFDAPFRGSMGATKLNKPVVGMVRYGDGYLMVGADGGIFNFSSAPFAGSLGDKPPASPVVAVAALAP
jgi:protocatechuate 3,4-dioxygenase beta subunit